MKFKNYIETESGIKDTSTSPGAAGQVLSSTVTGTSWIDQDTLVSAASKLVVIACKNTSGFTINKGTPVYQTGTVGATDVIEVAPADATITTGYLPAIGILQTTLINNNDPVTDPGNVVITGEFLNYSTLDIPSNNPGGVPITGDTVYLAPGGGLTCIKPTGAGNAIQNLGLIGKVSGGNAGSITVSSIMRANDVPNLPTGRIWIGDGNTIVSDTVYVDEPNNRVGIGTIFPGAKLEVVGESGVIIDSGTSNQAKLTLIGDAGTYGGGGIIDVIGAPSDYPAYNLNVKRGFMGPNTMEASNEYSGGLRTWSWDGNMGPILGQPYTSYDFKSQGSSQMVIYNNNVGIGTTSPFERLTIKGTDKYIAAEHTNYPWGGAFTIGAKIGTDVSAGLIDFRRWTGTGNNHNNGLITCGFNGKGMDFRVDTKTSNIAATTSRMHIALNGSVGIGTDVPDSKLEVASTDSNTYVHIRNDSTGSTRLKLSNATDTNANGFQIINNSLNGQVNLLNYKATTLALWTNSSQKLTILSGGNVGIGTTDPQAKLDVGGNANIGSLHTNFAGASYNVNLGFQNYNNGFAAIATGQNTLADASQSFSMGFQSKATGAASLAGGNVNISTALPSESAGQASIAFGNGVKTNSNANYSQAFGRGTSTGGGLTSANQAMAMGFNSIAFGDNSFSGGNNSRAFGEASFAFGEGASASKGDGNIALGIGVTTPASTSAANGVGQVAVGKYNVYNTGGVSHLFAVGAGTSDGSRFNAFNVTSTGRIGINGITNPFTILHAKINDYSTGFYMEGPSLSTSFSYMAFYGGTTYRGAIIPQGSNSIVYGSASDYRLKENVTKLQNSIERIKKLKPSNFNFLEDPSENVDGFIAHEVQEVVPQAVTGKKDAVEPNGEPIYQAIDQAKIIPLLTAALQESITKIEQLEQRIQTLENK